MRSTFKVLFYLKRNAPKKNGLIPVMCRIWKSHATLTLLGKQDLPPLATI